MFLLLLIAVLTLVCGYVKWIYSYWHRQGFPYVEAKIPFGILDSMRKGERSMGMAIYDAYKSSKEKVLGVYLISRPALLVRDAQLAHDILSKDFISFHDRGLYVDDENDPMSGSLFALQGEKWKTLRTKLAPSFTSGKLKSMFNTIDDISIKMLSHLNTQIPDEGSKQIEIRNILSSYAIDIIGSVIFGLEVNSFENPSNDFHKLKAQINDPSLTTRIRGTAQFLYPSLEKIFVRLGWKESAPEMMKNIVKQTINFREENSVTRNDMLQMLLQLRNVGKINTDDNIWKTQSVADAFKSMSVETIASQLFLFYIAGYETSASAAAFTIYELAQYPDLLAKAQKDVEEAIQKHNGKLTYDTLMDMKFVELCLMETVRKYPALPMLNRECTQDYPIPGTDKVIKKGTPILISLFGLHRDPEYFPDPVRYDPERFLEENMNYNPVAYMPFGEGPRHCIAQRMGKVNVKMAIARLLSNFNIEVNKDRKEIEVDTFGIPIQPKGGVHVTISKKKRSI